MSNSTPSDSKKQNNHPPELPKKARLSPELGLDACPWLDAFVEFCQHWSPRSYDGYHEGVGLWVLSTIAARRVSILFGKERYTNLYILLIGRTTLNAKSSVAQIDKELLSLIDLDFLLLPNDCTPQWMLTEMSFELPKNDDEINSRQKERVRLTLAFVGQRGLYLDEFGSNVQAMMRRDGPYSEFRGIFRRFDDAELRYERATITRGKNIIIRPYLALLGALTPSDLAPFAGKGSALWGDGFLARMAMIIPPDGMIKNGRFPEGERVFPDELLNPLREWHERLGIPEIKIEQGVLLEPDFEFASKLELSKETFEAYYNYDEALREILTTSNLPDLDGNYGRLPEKALRIAGLFASLGNRPTIELKHWARAQEIAARWRRDLHELYRQVNQQPEVAKKMTNREKVMRAIVHNGFPTKREIRQFTALSVEEIDEELFKLIDEGKLIEKPAGKTIRFRQTSLESDE